jgi:galactofuranose transport system ATP-binding protein
MTSADPAVRMRRVTVRYPGQLALDGVDLTLHAGEIHSLLGENGAGKSTLLKVLTGAIAPDEGEVLLSGTPVRFGSPAGAAAAGIGAVHQELRLLPNLTIAENILLGREPRRLLGIDWRAMHREAGEALQRLGLDIDPGLVLGEQSAAVRQLVAIARALHPRPGVLILDEPTASLDQTEVDELFRILRGLRDGGVAIVFVSHFLEQVYEIADRLTVLRNGRLVGEFLPHEILRRDLVGKMLGRAAVDLELLAERRHEDAGADGAPALLTARQVARDRALHPFDLDVFEGEVLGFAGLLGSGRSEVARALAGVDPIDSGTVRVDGDLQRPDDPRGAIARSVVYSSEDRREEGIIAGLTVRENIVLALQAQRGWFRRLSTSRQQELATSYIEALRIHPDDPEVLAGSLSGGNQQKVLLARLLALAPRILVLDEPTRGIDVGAKLEIQRLVDSLVSNGLSVLYVSTELDEVLRLSDRIAIMRDHRLVSVVDADRLSRDELLSVIAEGGADESR